MHKALGHYKRLALLIFIVIIIEIFVGWAAFRYARFTEELSLKTRAATIAASFEIEDIRKLAGNENDLQNPTYLSVKEKLVRIKRVNTDVRFVYLVGQREGKIFFYGDNEPAGSEDNSPPGQIYEEASETFTHVFEERQPLIDSIYSDRWGTWVSGLAPVIDPVNGSVTAVVGIDIQASSYYRHIILVTSVPMLLIGVLLLLIIIAYIRHTHDRDLLELKSRFVSIVSHDLHSPLNGIIWACDSMLLDTKDALSNTHRETITLMVTASKNLSSMISDLLNSGRMEREQATKNNNEEVDIRKMISEIINTISLNALEKSILIQVDSTFPENLTIGCDYQKTKEAFLNLVSNALKYSDKGAEVRIGYTKDVHGHVLSVMNTGCGIPEADQVGIFKPNYRASNAGRSGLGHGLGLYFAKGLIEVQHGEMWFKSIPGKSTTFFIRLPK